MKRALLAAAIVFAATAVQAQTQEECEAKWLAAEKAGIVFGVGMVGITPTAAVDEETFSNADFDTKTGFAVTLDCAVAGPGKHLAESSSSATGHTSGSQGGLRSRVWWWTRGQGCARSSQAVEGTAGCQAHIQSS